MIPLSDKRNSTGYSPNRIDTLIGAGTQISGNIECTGVLRVQGDVRGDVSCNSVADGALVVDGGGCVAGTIDAPRIVVRGRVTGPSHASQSIEIHQGACLVGDVSFRELAIHSGAIVEGALTPMAAAVPEAVAAPEPAVAAVEGVAAGGRRKFGVAAGLAGVAMIAAWAGSRLMSTAEPQEAAAVQQAAPVPAPVAAGTREARRDAAPVATAAVPDIGAAPPAPPANHPETAREEVAEVRGANPNRPDGVFLLVTQDAAILYKKQRDEGGTGTRIATSAGERLSVSIAPDELVRVATGRAVDIYFQGQKVPRRLVESGAWIRFVPRPASGEP